MTYKTHGDLEKTFEKIKFKIPKKGLENVITDIIEK